MPYFVYTLHLIDTVVAQDLSRMSPEQQAIIGEHFTYLQQLCAQEQLIMAGRTENPATGFGICLFKAANQTAAQNIMSNDPAVEQGVMSATLHPFRLALFQPQID